MFGKLYESLYEGSMVGAGSVVFAVWTYVIAKQRPDKVVGAQVTLNAKLLAVVIGEPEEAIEAAIKFLCSPDPQSRTKKEGGRRLIRMGEFDYQVVNGAKYREIRDEEQRRMQNRDAQERFRKKQLRNGQPLPGEQAYEKAIANGDEKKAEEILDSFTPQRQDAGAEQLTAVD